jgi:hypothetical protein
MRITLKRNAKPFPCKCSLFFGEYYKVVKHNAMLLFCNKKLVCVVMS